MSTTADDLLGEFPHLHDVTPVTDYEEIKDILASPHFAQAMYGDLSIEFMRGALNTLDGAEHLQRRRIFAKLFSRSALAFHKGERFEALVSDVLGQVRRTHHGDGPVRTDLVPVVWRMLHRLAASIAGVDGVESPDVTDRFVGLVKTFGRAPTLDWVVESQAHAVYDAGIQARDRLIEEFLRPSADRRRRLVEQFRAGDLPAEDLPLDLLTLLFLHREEDWDDDLIFRETGVLLMAATQTTSHVFPNFVRQFEDWLDRHPGYREGLAGNTDLLKKAVFEALRLFVAAPARLRRATADVVLPSGRKIADGELVALFFRQASTRSEKFGARAEEYDPLRETDGNVAPWGLAFGSGSHACIGRPVIVGAKQEGYSDGSLVNLAKHLYAAGMRLDPDRPPIEDETTYYDVLAELPVIFDNF